MEQNFHIIYFIFFGVFCAIFLFLIDRIRKERDIYKSFKKDGEMHHLLANDPKRFHISIVYLMTYMTRSDSKYKVQLDKLKIIVRYIREVIPSDYQEDAIKALKFLTNRTKGSGKNKKHESLVDVDDFLEGKNCLSKGDSSFHYEHDLHGKRLAEELAVYLSEDDRKYIMYLLYRLAIADGVITTEGITSELNMLNRLCVDGLKINKNDLSALIDSFKNGYDKQWYENNFYNRDRFYPSPDILADIFQMDMTSLSLLNKNVSQTSFVKSMQVLLFIICILIFIFAFFVMSSYLSDLMWNMYSTWISIAVGVVSVVLMFIVLYSIPRIESALVPILRTKIEDSLQKQGITIISILSIVTMCMMFWTGVNLLYLIGNCTFSNEKPIVITTPVTDKHTYVTKSKNSSTTHYVVSFSEVSLKDEKIDLSSRKEVTNLQLFCLNSLQYWTGMYFRKIENDKTMKRLEVTSGEYDRADGKNMVLTFKIGYFGLVYFDDYDLVQKQNTDEVVVPSEVLQE